MNSCINYSQSFMKKKTNQLLLDSRSKDEKVIIEQTFFFMFTS